MGELGGDLNGKLEKVKEAELELRTSEDSEKESLRAKLERLRKGLKNVLPSLMKCLRLTQGLK